MIGNDEAVVTDGLYGGPSTADVHAAPMVQAFKDAQTGMMTPIEHRLAKSYNKAVKSVRSSVEQAIGGGKKRGRDGIVRSSLMIHESTVSMKNEYKFLLHICKTKMRGLQR